MYREAYNRLVYRLELISDDIACYYENGDTDELRSSIANLLDLVASANSYGKVLAYESQKQNSLIANDNKVVVYDK